MTTTIGSSTSEVRALFKGLGFDGAVRPGAAGVRWLGRSKSGVVLVEVEGDPVTRVSLTLPTKAGAGTIVGQFCNQFAGDAARRWVAEVLGIWAGHVDRPLDTSRDFGETAVRVQSMLPLVVVTVGRRGQLDETRRASTPVTRAERRASRRRSSAVTGRRGRHG